MSQEHWQEREAGSSSAAPAPAGVVRNIGSVVLPIFGGDLPVRQRIAVDLRRLRFGGLSYVFSWTCGVSAEVRGEAELNCQGMPEGRRTCGYGWYQPAAAGTPAAARKSASIIFRAGL